MALSSPGTARLRRIRRVGPAQSLLIGITSLVVIGAFLLRLPIASRAGTVQPLVDALFTATSAVTTTGLIVVDTGSYYSPFGQMVILGLFQVGGLGYMAFSALVALLMGRSLSLRAGLTIQESMAGVTARELREFITSVLAYTLFFEALGAVALGGYWMSDVSVARALYLGLFHSVSAFCTAGFSLFPDSFVAYRGDVLVNVTVAVASCAGGVGFFVLRDLRQYLPLLRAGKRPRRLTLHTKLALSTWVPLVAAGSAILLLAEPRSLMGSGLGERLAAATFQAVSAGTTTGFNSVEIGKLSGTSVFWLLIVMFVGAAPAGTGGGIKSTTLGAVLAAAAARVRGGEDTVAFGRRLPDDTVRRALTIGLLATVVVASAALLLSATERQPFLGILFEVVSALGTVGLSAGVTPSLSTFGKLVISMTMLIGRLGPLAVGFGLLARPTTAPLRYAEERVFLG